MESAEKIAYGALRYSPEQLGRMLPIELTRAIAGYQDQQHHDYRKLAWLAATLINHTAAVKEPISVEDLLPSKTDSKAPQESLGQAHERILKRFEGIPL